MTFHSIQFPNDIAYGSRGGPGFSTDVVMTISGHEQRNANWSAARARYNVAHGIKSQAQLEELIAFFRARKGRAHAFRFKDWTDYTLSGEVMGLGDGTQREFQLTKTYLSGGVSEFRSITKPVAASVAVYVDGVEQSSGWSVDAQTGVVTFASPPNAGLVVAADAEFDVPVRFDTDQLSASLDDYGIRSWVDIPLVEVRA